MWAVFRHSVGGIPSQCEEVPSHCDARTRHSEREFAHSVMTLTWSVTLGWYLRPSYMYSRHVLTRLVQSTHLSIVSQLLSVSQSVSYFTVPPRAHPSTGSQSGSATPGPISPTRDWGNFQYKKREISIQDIIIYHHTRYHLFFLSL